MDPLDIKESVEELPKTLADFVDRMQQAIDAELLKIQQMVALERNVTAEVAGNLIKMCLSGLQGIEDRTAADVNGIISGLVDGRTLEYQGTIRLTKSKDTNA